MHLIVNGKTDAGLWRVDDTDSERLGIDFIMHPVAFLPDHDDAVKLCETVNKLNNVYLAAKDVMEAGENCAQYAPSCGHCDSREALEAALKEVTNGT